LLFVVERAVLRQRQKCEGVVERAGVVLGLRGDEISLCPEARVRSERPGALEESRRCCQTSTRLGTPGRVHKLERCVLIGTRRRFRTMPCAAFRIGKRVSGLGECAVHAPSSLRFRCLVHGGADERMAKTNASIDLKQAGRLSR
jgi:hypothetical protein